MATIGRLNYLIGADATGFVKGALATRKELSGIRRLFLESATEAELYDAQMAGLDDQLKRGIISEQGYARGLRTVRDSLTEVREAQERASSAAAKWNDHVDASRSPLTRYRDGLADLRRSLAAGDIDQAKYTDAVRGLRLELAQGLPGGGLLAGLATPMGATAAAIAAVTAVAVAAVASLAAVTSHAVATLESLDAIADQAALLGISAQAYADLTAAAEMADVSQAAVDGGLKRLLVTVSAASRGEKEAADALSMLGLSYSELQSLAPDEMFRKVVEALGELPTQAARLDAAQQIFGRGNVEIVQMALSMAEATEQVAGLREGLGEIDWQAVGEFDNASKELKLTWSQLSAVAASQLAPALTGLLRDAKDLLRDDATKRGLLTVFRLTELSLLGIKAAAAEIRPTLQWMWETGMPPFIQEMLDVMSKIDKLRERFGQIGMLPAPASAPADNGAIAKGAAAEEASAAKEKQDQLGTSIDSTSKALIDQAGATSMGADQYQLLQLKLQGATDDQLAWIASLQDARDAAQLWADIGALNDRLQEQIDTFGMSAAAIEEYRLAQRGATDDQLAYVREQQAELDSLEEIKKAREDAAKVIDGLRTPLQRVLAEEERLAALVEAGVLPIEAFSAAVADVRKKTGVGIVADFRFQGVEAAEYGSQQAIAAIARFRAEAEAGVLDPPKLPAPNIDGLDDLPELPAPIVPPLEIVPPDLSGLDLPPLVIAPPDISGVQMPEMPIDVPDLGGLDVPPLALDIEPLEVADVQLPDMQIDVPDLGGLDVPPLALAPPDVAGLQLPEMQVDLPDPGELTVPAPPVEPPDVGGSRAADTGALDVLSRVVDVLVEIRDQAAAKEPIEITQAEEL